jgi:hypothetical protein
MSSNSIEAAVGAADGQASDDRRSVAAASLAALAESGIIFLPFRQLLVENVRAHEGPLATYPLFVALFVGGTAWVTLRRRGGHTVQIGVAIALALTGLQAFVWGSADAAGALFMGVLVLLVTMRLLALSHRDWQDPVGWSLAVGMAVLLLEVAAASTSAAWHGLLFVVVPQFFLGSLASRAASVRLVTRPVSVGPHEDTGGAGRLRLAMVSMAALGAMMGAAALLGGKGGVLEMIGRLLYLILSGLVIAVAFVIARVILPPVAWLIARLHINLDYVQRALRRFRSPASDPGTFNKATQTGWLRVVGFLMLVAMFLLLLRGIRRRWYRMLTPELRAPDFPHPLAVPLSRGRRIRRGSSRTPRWEPPADTVRRWYAEALMLLERRGLPKASSHTPGEFAPQVARAFPDSAHSFEALTRAYEQVRYGSVAIERSALQQLADQRTWAMEVFQRSERRDQADDKREA